MGAGTKHPGDPSPRSASDVLADQHYKLVVSEQSRRLGGQLTNTLVVLHCGTETHWMTTYPITKMNDAMTWERVEPVIETRTTYRPVL